MARSEERHHQRRATFDTNSILLSTMVQSSSAGSPRKRRSEKDILLSTPHHSVPATPLTARCTPPPEDTPEKAHHRRDPTGLRLLFDDDSDDEHRKRRRSRTEWLLWLLFVLGLFTISVVMILNHNHLAQLEATEQKTHQQLLHSRLRPHSPQVSLNHLSSTHELPPAKPKTTEKAPAVPSDRKDSRHHHHHKHDDHKHSSDHNQHHHKPTKKHSRDTNKKKKKAPTPPRAYIREHSRVVYRLADIPRPILPHRSSSSHPSKPIPPFQPDNVVVPGSHRRVVYLSGEPASPLPRRQQLKDYPSDYTDPTQLYSLLDSSDERISTMELRPPYKDKHCEPMQDWQTTFYPSCNGMHELAWSQLGSQSLEDDFTLFGMNGFWRNAWKLESMPGHNSVRHRDTLVLKTLRIHHRFEDAYFENHRIDALVLERLTKSPHVINVFGFCGHSVLTEYADGKRLGELADKKKKIPLARLQIARDVANGLADVHSIDGDDQPASFVHLDINPANVVSIGGTLKLNDFNIGVLKRWNTTSNTACDIPAQYPNPQWRSPEEAMHATNLDEMVDVFSLGHIFFRLICGHEPWHKLEPGGMPSKEVLTRNVKEGKLPTIPDFVLESEEPEVVAIRAAMLEAYTYDPKKRPSARTIANRLQATLEQLEAVEARAEHQ